MASSWRILLSHRITLYYCWKRISDWLWPIVKFTNVTIAIYYPPPRLLRNDVKVSNFIIVIIFKRTRWKRPTYESSSNNYSVVAQGYANSNKRVYVRLSLRIIAPPAQRLWMADGLYTFQYSVYNIRRNMNIFTYAGTSCRRRGARSVSRAVNGSSRSSRLSWIQAPRLFMLHPRLIINPLHVFQR